MHAHTYSYTYTVTPEQCKMKDFFVFDLLVFIYCSLHVTEAENVKITRTQSPPGVFTCSPVEGGKLTLLDLQPIGF